MSKQSDQTLVMLAVAAGVLETIKQGRCFAKIDLQERIEVAIDALSTAILLWPLMNNRRWIQDRRKTFMYYVEKLPKNNFPAVELVMMVERLVVDLSHWYDYGEKGNLIAPVVPTVEALVKHVDPEGLNFAAMEEAGRILDVLYDLLGIEEKAFC